MTPAERLRMLRLKQKAAMSEAPPAEDEPAAPPEPPPGPSVGDAALAGVQQLGAMGWGDELGAALQGGLAKVTGTGDYLDTYRQARDENRAQTKAAKEAHPSAYYAAGLPAAVGSGLAMPAVKVGQGAALLTRAVAQGLNGALMGAATGAGESEGGFGQNAVDTLAGGGMGAGIGAALPVASAAVRKAASPITTPTAKWLQEKAVDVGRKVLTNGADSLSSREAVRDSAVLEAIRSGAIRPFGNTKSTLDRLGTLSEQQHNTYNQLVARLAEKGVRGPEAAALAKKLLDEATELEANTLNRALPDLYRDVAEQVVSPAKHGGRTLLSASGNPGGQRLGLVQSENLKRSQQALAKYGRFEETPVNEVRRDIASVLRQANEEAIEEQAKQLGPEAATLASQFRPTKMRLGNLIEAERAAIRGASRGAQRNAVGLKDLMAAGAATAAGRPDLAVPAAAASNFANNRLPSAIASYGLGTADALRRGHSTPEAAQTLQALILALQAEDDEVEAPQSKAPFRWFSGKAAGP